MILSIRQQGFTPYLRGYTVLAPAHQLAPGVHPLRYSKRINFECTVPLPSRPARQPKAPKRKTRAIKTNISKKPPQTPTPLELQERRQKQHEYEQIRGQRPERPQSARDRQKNYDKRPKNSAYARLAPSRPSQARPDAHHARQNTGNKIRKLPLNDVRPGSLRNRTSPPRRCHRVVTRIKDSHAPFRSNHHLWSAVQGLTLHERTSIP